MNASTAPASLTLDITGMTCASCVARVEKALSAVPGVAAAEVNFATETASVQGRSLDPQQLVAAVHKAGYEAAAHQEETARPAVEAPSGDTGLSEVVLSALLTLPLLVPMVVLASRETPNACSACCNSRTP